MHFVTCKHIQKKELTFFQQRLALLRVEDMEKLFANSTRISHLQIQPYQKKTFIFENTFIYPFSYTHISICHYHEKICPYFNMCIETYSIELP